MKCERVIDTVKRCGGNHWNLVNRKCDSLLYLGIRIEGRRSVTQEIHRKNNYDFLCRKNVGYVGKFIHLTSQHKISLLCSVFFKEKREQIVAQFYTIVKEIDKNCIFDAC